MSNNPLKQYFRRPAVYLRLPSNGADYKEGVLDLPESGELPVYPMTAIDEITTRTPDALFNGTAIVDLIKSCVPNIIDPWQVSSTDMDAILLAIKAASGSQNLEIDSTCPKCSEPSTYGLELAAILSTLKAPDYSVPLEVGELKIKFGPLTYTEMNQAGMAQFEIQRLFNNVDQTTDIKEKNDKTKQALIAVTEVTMEVIAKTIQHIQTPGVVVDSYEHILDFIKNCDKNVYLAIRDYHTSLKEQTELKPLEITCGSCQHNYTQAFTINASDFFA
jgi:bacterioferritin-associated ferredoxin